MLKVLGVLAGLAVAVFFFAIATNENKLTAAEARCANVAEKVAPVGYADKETYMNAYRACVGRN